MKEPATQATKKTGSYNGIRISSILFLLIITAILAVNISISRSLNYDATSINLSGRQRMLSQNIAKNTKMIEQSLLNDDFSAAAKSIVQLKNSHNLFDQTLSAFAAGGDTLDATRSPVTLKEVTIDKIKKDLVVAQEIWSTIEPDIRTIISQTPQEISQEVISRLSANIDTHNMTLLKLMNNLTVGLDIESKKKSSQLEIILLVALAFVIFNFFYIVTHSLSKLKKSDEEVNKVADSLKQNNNELAQSNKTLFSTQKSLSESNKSLEDAMISVQQSKQDVETKNETLESLAKDLNRLKEESDKIFSSVDHGLCLLTPDFEIGKRISKAMYEIFEKESLSGISFLDLMRPLITDKDLNTLESYLKLQFNGKTMPQQLEKFNPLKNIEMTLNWDGKSFTNKYVGFEFERVMHDNNVELLLVTVTDVTQKIALQKNLDQANADQEKKSRIIMEIIQAEPDELTRVITQSQRCLDEINTLLRSDEVSDQASLSNERRADIVNEIFRKIHNTKGNASMLGLVQLAEISHTVENELGELRKSSTVTGDQLLGSLVQLSAMRELLDDYTDVRDGFLQNHKVKFEQSSEKSPENQLHNDLNELTQKVASKMGKKIHLRTDFDLQGLDSKRLTHIKDIFIQLIRNSAVHGVEEPTQRLKSGKLKEALIYISIARSNNKDGDPTYEFTFRDDGAGLNVDAIRKKAIEQGLISEADAKDTQTKNIIKLLFKPGFTTLNDASEHAGRGVGMDIVKQTVVDDLNGKLSLSYRLGQYTEFSWSFLEKIPSTALSY